MLMCCGTVGFGQEFIGTLEGDDDCVEVDPNSS